MSAAARNAINKLGRTQIRLRFGVDDNNDNAADYMKFLSGDFTSGQPELVQLDAVRLSGLGHEEHAEDVGLERPA